MEPYRSPAGTVTTLRDSILDRAGLARMDLEENEAPRHVPEVRLRVGVRGAERDPGGLEDGARRVIGAGAQTALRRRGVPRVIVAAITVAWAVAIAAEITGTARLVHHDALAHSDLPLIAVLGIFVIAWQLMIVA